MNDTLTTAIVKRIRARSGNRDNDYFQPVCQLCEWEGATYSNRTTEGKRLAYERAAGHNAARREAHEQATWEAQADLDKAFDA